MTVPIRILAAGVAFVACASVLSGDGAMPQYDRLLANPRIRAVLEWPDAAGSRFLPYDRWDTTLKSQLAAHLATLESGGTLRAATPSDPQVLGEQDARAVYTMRAAVSLWVEAHHRVAWSLLDYSDRELQTILSPRRLFRVDGGRYRWLPPVADLNPHWDLRFMLDAQAIPYLAQQRAIVGATHEQTAIALLDRLRTLRHRGERDELAAQGPPAEEIVATGISSGCWGTSGLILTLMRAVNIPVERVTHVLDGAAHCSVNFPTLGGKTIVHGDDPYNRLLLAIPSRELLIDNASEWLPMSRDEARLHHWNALRKASCINARAILETSCRSRVFQRLYANELAPHLTPDESRAFLASVEAIAKAGCDSFSADNAVAFPIACWAPDHR